MSDFAVAHVEDAIGNLGGLGVVGNHEDSLVEFAAGLAEHLENSVRVFGVEVASGLVGENDGGTVDQGAGDSDALLLAAGEFVRAMVEAPLNAKHLGKVVEKGLVQISLGGCSKRGDVMGDFDVVHRGEGGEKVKALKDEADLRPAHPGALGIGEFGKVSSINENRASRGAGETAKDVEEGGFAGAGGTYDGDELAGNDGKVDVAKGGDFEFTGAVGLAEVLGKDDRRGGGAGVWSRGQRGRM